MSTKHGEPLPLTDDITASLREHGINPATVACIDNRTWMGNGAVAYVTTDRKPTIRATRWHGGEWSVQVSGRYLRDDDGEPVVLPSIGAALTRGMEVAR